MVANIFVGKFRLNLPCSALHSRCGDDCSDGMGDSFKQWLPPHLQTLRLHPGLHLPADVCEKLLSTLYDLGMYVSHVTLTIL